MNIKHLYAIAYIETKLLMRSITVRILWFLFLLITLFFILVSHVDGDFQPKIPGALATKAFFLFSLLRMFAASFIAPVFVKDDRKNNSFQVLSARPFSNTSYIFGKIIGFISVMLLMDYVFMLILFVSSLFLPNMPVSVWPYLVYPLIITLPLSIFLFGVNVFAAQLFYPFVYLIPLVLAMLFLPLEDIEATRYLDLGAITLPLAYSAITGFYEMNMVIIQRIIYLLGGIGFILGASLLMQFCRRSDNRIKHIRTISLIIVIFLFSVIYVKFYNLNTENGQNKRRGTYFLTKGHPPLRIISCDLTVIHKNESLDVHAHLKITNPNEISLDRFRLKHNAGFVTYNVTSGNRIKKFYNPIDAIDIELNTPLEPNESMELEISYSGSVWQTRTYFHIPAKMYDLVHRSGLTTLGKQSAFLERDYVLLPAEVTWYPTSYSEYQPPNPGYNKLYLTDFSLEVTTHEGLTVISQGKMTDKGNNTYLFEPETPLTKISLTIGHYEKTSINVDDVDYSYYWIGKSPFTDCGFSRRDLEKSIRRVKEQVENTLQLEYPFERFQIVETPVHFFGFHSPLDLSGPYEQPEIRFIPESSLALKNHLKTRGGKAPDCVTILTKELFPKLYQTKTDSRAILSKLNPPSSILNLGGMWQFTTDPFLDYSNLITQYAVFSRGPVSDNDYFNLLAVNWLRSQFFYNSDTGNGLDLNYRPRDSAALHYFSTKSLKDILADETYYPETMDILNMASKTFFNLLAAKSRIDISEFEKVLLHGFSTPGVDVAVELSKLCGFDVIEVFDEFSEQTEKAHYELTDITVAKHFIDDRYLYNARFNISNPTPYPGLVECSLYARYPENNKKTVYLEPFSKKEVGLVVSEEVRGLAYQWLPFGSKDTKSYKAPNKYNWPVSIKVVNAEEMAFFDGVRDIEVGTVPVSVVMDNLDDGCRVVSPQEKNILKRFVEKRRKNSSLLKFVYFSGLDKPPVTWALARTRGESDGLIMFYGEFSSCYYTQPGDGESAVEYVVPIPELGQYNVYLSVPNNLNVLPSGRPEPGDVGETTVRVFADDGPHEDVTDVSHPENDWAYVGTYSFSDTTAVVQITDKSKAKIVVADAVKLSKVE